MRAMVGAMPVEGTRDADVTGRCARSDRVSEDRA
jgi:hypothetical protein